MRSCAFKRTSVHFIERLLSHLSTEFCIDEARLHAYGQSNGAMFTHHLVSSLPGRFRHAIPVYGTPLLGYLTGAQYELMRSRERASRTTVFALHPRGDVTIPPQVRPCARSARMRTCNTRAPHTTGFRARCCVTFHHSYSFLL